MRKNYFFLLTLALFLFQQSVWAAPSLVGLSTDGTVYDISLTDGTLTLKTQEQITNFTLGGLTRKKDKLYYVAAPSGTSENAIYTVDLKTNALSHVDLDRAGDVRILFFKGKSLYGLFYDILNSVNVICKIDPTTGVTTQILDLISFESEPIGGAIAQIGKFYYLLAKPDVDSTKRKLIKFKLKEGSATIVDVLSKEGADVRCDKIKVNAAKEDFVCLASVSDSQVDVCRLSTAGKAKCKSTLEDVLRLGSGHTMATPDQKTYYALVYSPEEQNDQRLIKFNARGKVKSTFVVDGILIGAEF